MQHHVKKYFGDFKIIFVHSKPDFLYLECSLSLFCIAETYLNISRPDPGRREKININFYFHISFKEDILIQLSQMLGAERVKFFLKTIILNDLAWNYY